MAQQLKNNGNDLRSGTLQFFDSRMSLLVGAVFSFAFAVRQMLFGFVNHAHSLVMRTGKAVKHGAQTFYRAVLHPVGQKLAPFFGGVNRWVLSPVSQVLVFVFAYSIVKPLGLLAVGSQAVAQSLWDLSKKVLAEVLRSAVYQKLCKPYFIRPLLKVAGLVNAVCVDFPAQVITWLFCAALAAVAQGGVRLSDVVSRGVRGVQELSLRVAKQLLALYRAYDTFAIVPIDYASQSSQKLRETPEGPASNKLDYSEGRCPAVEPSTPKAILP